MRAGGRAGVRAGGRAGVRAGGVGGSDFWSSEREACEDLLLLYLRSIAVVATAILVGAGVNTGLRALAARLIARERCARPAGRAADRPAARLPGRPPCYPAGRVLACTCSPAAPV